MKKKILYGLLFTSLMIISTVSVIAQPASGANWKFGVPDAAVGMTLESEVKVYDKEEWGKHVGNIGGENVDDNVNNWFGGDQTNANDVGATSKSKILGWKNDDIYFFGDQLMHSEIGTNDYNLGTYWDGVSFAKGSIDTLYTNLVGYYGALSWMVANSHPGNATILGWLGALDIAMPFFAASTPSIADCEILYDKTYKGVIVERNKKEFDLDHDPKDDWDLIAQNLPFIEDPHDILDSYNYFIGFAGELFGIMDTITYNGGTYIYGAERLTTPPNKRDALWAAAEGVMAIPAGSVSAPSVGLIDLAAGTADAIKVFFATKIPDKKEYLNLLLRGGLPAHQPVDKWWEKVLDDFAIEDDNIYGNVNEFHKGGVDQDGNVITVAYEWELGAEWIDVDGIVVPYDDYEVVYTYGDTGGQSSVEFKGSDPFYKIESLAPVIPGYEISILLATAAISAIALIYVVMKKKRM